MSRKTSTADMTEAAKPALVPKLRFPEFQAAGDWTTEQLGTVAAVSTQKVGSNICVPMSITSGVGLVSQEDKFGRVIAGDSYKNYLLLKPNEFAYNKSATKEYPEGFLTLYMGTELAAVPNSIFTCFRINGESPDVRFLNYQFSDNLHGRWLRKFIQVGARAHGSLSINEGDLMALPVPIPAGTTSLVEQQKIADCLSSVDELIATQARKVDALKTHKNGLMQQLFPREAKNQPRLRFPEFRDAAIWNEVAAGQLFSNRVERGNSRLPIYSVTINDGMVPRSSLDRRIDDIAECGANKTVSKGDIAYNMMRMWQGALGVAPVDCMVSPAYIVLKPKAANTVFFSYVLKQPQMLRVLTAYSRGLTEDRLRLYYDDFAKVPLLCPSVVEQNRIADFLSSLDSLITVQTQALETLKTHKKGLMQQLFPLAEAVEG